MKVKITLNNCPTCIQFDNCGLKIINNDILIWPDNRVVHDIPKMIKTINGYTTTRVGGGGCTAMKHPRFPAIIVIKPTDIRDIPPHRSWIEAIF